VAQTYVTVLFAREEQARDAQRDLEKLAGVRVHRAFLVRRDASGLHVEGRDEGEAPRIDIRNPFPILRAVVSRLLRGAGREEDSVAVADAEEELSVGQAALVALIHEDEHAAGALDDVMHAHGGTVTRTAPATLDSEDTQRFLFASSLDSEERSKP
jgi:hypothetical protein